MKTTILTLAVFFATVFGITQSTYAATNNDEQVSTEVPGVSTINEIEVHGNVQLYVSDGTTDKVKVYDNYYGQNAFVQDENGVLHITSYGPEKLVVWVTVSELAKLSAYDNAEVKSFGKLSSIDLDVKLFDNASAKLDVNTYATSITLNDHAKADLAGTVTEGSLQYHRFSLLNTQSLAATHIVTTIKDHRIRHDHPREFASI